MASINHCMLSPTHTPVPLPREKLLLTTPSINLQLFPHLAGSPLNQPPPAKSQQTTANAGTLYTSNQRIVFVAPSPSPSPPSPPESASSGAASTPLTSLSVPLDRLVDGRLVQPWFSASYYEAVCLPAQGGGLSVRPVYFFPFSLLPLSTRYNSTLLPLHAITNPAIDSDSLAPTAQGPHLLRLHFKEAGGFDFVQMLQEMRDRLDASGGSSRNRRGGGGGDGDGENLPAYTPPTTITTASSPPSTLSATPTPSCPTSHLPFPPHLNPQQLHRDQPSPSTLDAARVARAAEEREREGEVRAGGWAGAGEGGGGQVGEGEGGEAPPGYFEA
ncbi:hypothetical protein JCM11641_004434 [Rhodosporidiobolus odoratus]